MKKIGVIMAIVVAFAIGSCVSHTETQQAVVATTKVEAPAKSVQEFAKRYDAIELTSQQRGLAEAGFYYDKIQPIIVK